MTDTRVLVVITILATSSAVPNRRQGFNFPPNPFTTPPTLASTQDNYIFEGVNYERLPKDFQLEHNDCYGWLHRCIRMRTYLVHVCGYNTRTWYYDDYYSPCEIEFESCRYRVKEGYGVYGTDYNNDYIYYNGEELNCLYYYRRAGNSLEMDELYFGTKNPPYRSKSTPEKYLRNRQEPSPFLENSTELYQNKPTEQYNQGRD